MWLAHLLTVARIPLAVAFWLVAPHPHWAVSVLGVAALTDLADGHVARRARQRAPQTGRWADAGAWLDPLCDKTFAITVLTALAVRLDVGIGLLLLIAARELVLVPLALIYRLTPLHDRFRYDFRSMPAGKHATIAQFLAIVAILLEVPGATVLAIGAAIVGLDAAARYLARARQAARTAF
jgi:phosphatidylglycerophosphate synthase